MGESIFLYVRRNAITAFLVCNLRPVLEKVKFNVRRSLEPFKDLDGRLDPSLILFVSRILSASV